MQHLYMADGSVNPKLLKRNIIIYGCGNDGKKLYLQLESLKVNVAFFCDSNRELWGKKLFGISILSPEELGKYRENNVALAFHDYPQILDKIPATIKENVFADYVFAHKGKRACILCGNEDCTYDRAHFAPFLVERMLLGQNKETKLIHCLHCGLYFSDYRPDETEMGRLYDKYRDEAYVEQRRKYEPNYSNGEFYGQNILEGRKKRVVNFIEPYIEFANIKSVLDYGGDKGQFIPEAFVNAEKYVYDISGNKTIEGVTLLSEQEEIKQKNWNFVMCTHLLEHVSEPKAIISDLVSIMKNDTYLYIELPYETCMHQYSDIEINEHINFFRETTMEAIAKLFGLRILNIETDKDGIMKALYGK